MSIGFLLFRPTFSIYSPLNVKKMGIDIEIRCKIHVESRNRLSYLAEIWRKKAGQSRLSRKFRCIYLITLAPGPELFRRRKATGSTERSGTILPSIRCSRISTAKLPISRIGCTTVLIPQ